MLSVHPILVHEQFHPHLDPAEILAPFVDAFFMCNIWRGIVRQTFVDFMLD